MGNVAIRVFIPDISNHLQWYFAPLLRLLKLCCQANWYITQIAESFIFSNATKLQHLIHTKYRKALIYQRRRATASHSGSATSVQGSYWAILISRDHWPKHVNANVIDYSLYVSRFCQLGATEWACGMNLQSRGLSAPGLKRANNAHGLPESRALCCQL